MGTATASSVTRISVGRRWLSWPAFALLYGCFIVALFSLAGIIKRPRELVWWFATSLAILSAWTLIRRQLRRDRDWDDITYIELGDGAVTYVPNRKMRREQGLATAKASFPLGSSLECQIATGDRYFTGDHGERLLTSLWIVQPDGTRHCLLSDVIDVNLQTTVTNLRRAGLPFPVIKVYDGQEGEHTETDVTGRYLQTSRRSRTPISILLGTSSLWMGAVAAGLTRNVVYVAAIGVLSFVTTAVVGLRSTASKRSALLNVATLIPSYAGGYALAVVAVWYIFKR